MKKCLICNVNDANQTGSHIVPHFLSKRVDNQEGEKGRDKELGFVVDINDSRMYFGRGILPEKLEEVYGEVDDELLAQNNIDGIVDNIFCDKCEKKLGVIESAYSKSLNTIAPAGVTYESNKEVATGFLFWVSVIWRLSLMQGNNFILKDKERKKLSRILKRYLDVDINKIELDANDADLADIGYKILRAPDFSERLPTVQYSHPFHGRPYTIMVDEYIIFFYFKKSYLKGMPVNFFGSLPLQHGSYFNTPFNEEKILSVSDDEYKSIINNMMKFFAEKKMEKLNKNMNLIHQKMFPNQGKEMDPRLKSIILKKISDNEIKVGKRNRENDFRIIQEAIVEYYDIKE